MGELETRELSTINGVVVAVPRENRTYLITEVPTAFGTKKKIIPFEEVPIEERVMKTLHSLGQDVSTVAKEIVASIKEKKEEKAREVI